MLYDQLQRVIAAGDTEQVERLLLTSLVADDASSRNNNSNHGGGPAVAAFHNINQSFAGRTVLDYAAWKSRVKIVRLLLRYGADPNQTGQGGRTALHQACWGRVAHSGVVRALLEEGHANPNIQDDKGRTALHWCSCLGRVKLGELLLEHGADIGIRDTGGSTALDTVGPNHPQFMRLLLQHGGDANHRDQKGQTLLHRWAMVEDSQVVDILLEFGADPNKADARNATVPLDIACQHGSLSSVYSLFKRMITDGGIRSKNDVETRQPNEEETLLVF